MIDQIAALILAIVCAVLVAFALSLIFFDEDKARKKRERCHKIKDLKPSPLYADFEKCRKVIASCETQEQLQQAAVIINLFFEKHKDYGLKWELNHDWHSKRESLECNLISTI